MDNKSMFKYYIENFYTMPEDIKQDIVYCQRSIRSFISVHQMVGEVFKKQSDADPVQKQRILAELEADVVEINAEQQYVMLRLNDSLEQFYKLCNRKGIDAEREFAKDFVSKMVVPLVSDATFIAHPKMVRPRPNVNDLIRRHFLFSSDSNDMTSLWVPSTGNIDNDFGMESDDMEITGLLGDNSQEGFPQSSATPVSVVSLSDDDVKIIESSKDSECADKLMGLVNELDQIVINDEPETVECVELIQPQDEAKEIVAGGRSNATLKTSRRSRKTKQRPRVFDEDEDSDLVMPNLTLQKSVEATSPPEQQLDDSQPETTQALIIKPKASKKLATGNQQKNANTSLTKKKVVAVKKKGQGAGATATATAKATSNNNNNNTKKNKTRKLPVKKANNSNATSTSGTSSSISTSGAETNIFSSDDSNLEPRQTNYWNEPVERRSHPIEYGQEAFLAMFELFTPSAVAHMQQRRSKRQRRNIHTTERSDFHYERFEMMQADGSKKKNKNKEFLLAPKVKRMRAKKGNNAATGAATGAAAGNSKRSTPEKIGEEPSTSTGLSRGQYLVVPRRAVKSPPSPNDKLKCKECLKDNEPLLPCSVCDHMFHQACHEDGGKPHPHIKCPNCYSNWKIEMLKCIHASKPHNAKGYGNKKGDGGGSGNGAAQTK